MAVTIAMFVAFARGRYREEIISLVTIAVIGVGLYFAPLEGTKPTDGLAIAFGGFGHSALITICALMIMGRGLVVTGALDPAARALNRVWRFNRQLGLLVTLALALAGGLYAFTRIKPDFRARTRVERVVMVLLFAASLVALRQTGGAAPVSVLIVLGGIAVMAGACWLLLASITPLILVSPSTIRAISLPKSR